MEWIIWLAVLFMVGSTAVNVRTKSQITRALEGKPEVIDKMLEAPLNTPKHRLARTWIVSTREGQVNAGWRWKCYCGVWGVASDTKSRFNPTDNTTAYSIGTEKTAIEGFKAHAEQYQEVSRNVYKELYEKEQADFAEYRKLCYCKDANDALLPWKDK